MRGAIVNVQVSARPYLFGIVLIADSTHTVKFDAAIFWRVLHSTDISDSGFFAQFVNGAHKPPVLLCPHPSRCVIV